MRQFETKADYYACIVESAQRALKDNPDSTLHRQVTLNYSGGHSYWDGGAKRIYQEPANLDEALLALELRSILYVACQNQLKEILSEANTLERPLEVLMGIPMLFGLLTRTATKLAYRDPVAALSFKIGMSKIATYFEPKGLPAFISIHCYHTDDITEGDGTCSLF